MKKSSRKSFPRSLFLQNTCDVAKSLLGAKLETVADGIATSGIIVEVEAYHQNGDEAAHSCRGKTERNKVMFDNGGCCYVYLIYGMYYCVNVVTEKKDIGAAVLIRALEPLDGIQYMRKRRKTEKDKNLTNGPGKLCQSLAIDKCHLGEDLLSSDKINLSPFINVSDAEIDTSSRIGISKSIDLEWRYYIRDSKWVSR